MRIAYYFDSKNIHPSCFAPVITKASLCFMHWGINKNKKLISTIKWREASTYFQFKKALSEHKCIVPMDYMCLESKRTKGSNRYKVYLFDRTMYVAGFYYDAGRCDYPHFAILTYLSQEHPFVGEQLPIILQDNKLSIWMNGKFKTVEELMEYNISHIKY